MYKNTHMGEGLAYTSINVPNIFFLFLCWSTTDEDVAISKSSSCLLRGSSVRNGLHDI